MILRARAGNRQTGRFQKPLHVSSNLTAPTRRVEAANLYAALEAQTSRMLNVTRTAAQVLYACPARQGLNRTACIDR